jgi:hypothetical protein
LALATLRPEFTASCATLRVTAALGAPLGTAFTMYTRCSCTTVRLPRCISALPTTDTALGTKSLTIELKVRRSAIADKPSKPSAVDG